MKLIIFVLSLIFINTPAFSTENYLTQAIMNVKSDCLGISTELEDMKKMAGISTAVTSVGTVVAGGALATGIAKTQKDSEIESYEEAINKLNSIKHENKELDYIALSKEEIYKYLKLKIMEDISYGLINQLNNEKEELEKKSKTLGNIRTGLMAGDTAINVTNAVLSGNNKIKGDLKNQINACIQSVKNLSKAKQQARIENNISEEEIKEIDKIVQACSEWEYLDISKINSKSDGAMTSSIIGATSGIVGTITSAATNSEKIRQNNSFEGNKKEKNLNTASNVLVGTTAGASLASTIFSATQIKTIKDASEIANKCEETLR